jgi:hypothetical protein
MHPKPIHIRDIYIRFDAEEQCLQYVEQMRWPDGIIRCRICGNDKVKKVRREKESKDKRPWFYLCLEKTCHQQFSPTAAPCSLIRTCLWVTWFHVIGLALNAKKGISAAQLHRDLGLGGYKTAWYLLHRIRESMVDGIPAPLGGTVEIDETYLGGKQRLKRNAAALKNKHVVMVRSSVTANCACATSRTMKLTRSVVSSQHTSA